LVRKHEPPQGTPTDAVDRLRLARAEGVGPVAYRRLLSRYGSATTALEALPELARAGGRSSAPAIPPAEDVSQELRNVARQGGRIIFAGEPDYPPLLALLDDAPATISVLGDWALLASRSVALVGGRNASANGQRVAENLAADLACS
jgi:DNA processing protein